MQDIGTKRPLEATDWEFAPLHPAPLSGAMPRVMSPEHPHACSQHAKAVASSGVAASTTPTSTPKPLFDNWGPMKFAPTRMWLDKTEHLLQNTVTGKMKEKLKLASTFQEGRIYLQGDMERLEHSLFNKDRF